MYLLFNMTLILVFIYRIVEDAARNRLFQDGRDAFDLVSLNIQVNLLYSMFSATQINNLEKKHG